MSCSRAFEIDLEDLLAEPESQELRELEAHSASCPDCASELTLQRGLMARLRGDDTGEEASHPSDAVLLSMRRNPEALSDSERTRVRAHLRDCAPCDDAFRATAMLVPEPGRSPIARLVESLRGWLVPGGVPAWASSAFVLLLVSGLILTLDPFGLRVGEPGPTLRGPAREVAAEVDLEVGDRGALSLYGLSDDDVVRLRLALPEVLGGEPSVRVRISIEGGAELDAEDLAIADADGSEVVLERPAGSFERDSYTIEVTGPRGGTHVYRLDVR